MFPFTAEGTHWVPHMLLIALSPDSPSALSFPLLSKGEKLCKVLQKMTLAGLKQLVTSTGHGRKEPAPSKQHLKSLISGELFCKDQ